jgi:hypothetical protein
LSLSLLLGLALVVRADEELPPDAKKAVEEHEKAAKEILDKAEAELRRAQEAHEKAQAEVKARKDKLVAQLEELAKHLEKQGKTDQAKAVAEYALELKTGRIAGAQPDPGTLGAFRGQNGQSFLFEVTGQMGGAVWGTDTYTDDSSLATATVHAGILKVGEKGVVKVTILPGQASYTGSTRNGVSTGDWGAWGGSYKVEASKRLKRAAAPVPGAIPDPGSLVGFRGQNGKTLLIEVTGRVGGAVWGTDIYTDDSALATVVVHAGILQNGEKGVVKVTILPGEQQYTGSTQNGVESSNYPAWDGSYKVERVKK